MLTSVDSSLWKTIQPPQSAQNCRRIFGEDTYVAGDPAVQEKLAAGKVVQATTGAPVLRWHMRQWQ